MVQQLKANDQNWEQSVPSSHEPLYVKRHGTATMLPTQIPTPVFRPKVPIANRPVVEETETPTQSPKQDVVQPNISTTSSSVLSVTSESSSAANTPDQGQYDI